jgi:hypothetical protein
MIVAGLSPLRLVLQRETVQVASSKGAQGEMLHEIPVPPVPTGV